MKTAAAALTRDPQRLAALCALWQAASREVWITLQGVSMTPTLLPGSRLLLRCGLADVAVGRVIAFRREGRLIIHRLVEMEENPAAGTRRYTCLGDGNTRRDPPVPESAVVGVIVAAKSPPLRASLPAALRHPRRHARWVVRALRRRWTPGATYP